MWVVLPLRIVNMFITTVYLGTEIILQYFHLQAIAAFSCVGWFCIALQWHIRLGMQSNAVWLIQADVTLHSTMFHNVLCQWEHLIKKKTKQNVILQTELIEESKNNFPSLFLSSSLLLKKKKKKRLKAEASFYQTHKNNIWRIHSSWWLYNTLRAELRRENNFYLKTCLSLYRVNIISHMWSLLAFKVICF